MANTVTQLLEQWPNCSAADQDRVIAALYEGLKEEAQRIMRSEPNQAMLQPTLLVNEAYLRLIEVDRITWEGRRHFLGVAGKLMRQIVVDIARREHAEKRDARLATSLPTDLDDDSGTIISLLDIEGALQQLAQADPVYEKLVEARIFTGLTIAETAELLEMSTATVKRKWLAIQHFLLDYISRQR